VEGGRARRSEASRHCGNSQGQIPGLLETSVGVNFSPRSQGYELGGVMKFADQSALDAYGGAPYSSGVAPMADAPN